LSGLSSVPRTAEARWLTPASRTAAGPLPRAAHGGQSAPAGSLPRYDIGDIGIRTRRRPSRPGGHQAHRHQGRRRPELPAVPTSGIIRNHDLNPRQRAVGRPGAGFQHSARQGPAPGKCRRRRPDDGRGHGRADDSGQVGVDGDGRADRPATRPSTMGATRTVRSAARIVLERPAPWDQARAPSIRHRTTTASRRPGNVIIKAVAACHN
jgi:hypothetical protein